MDIKLQVDAVPYGSWLSYCSADNSTNDLDNIIQKLSIEDYRSIFFLMMDCIGPREFLIIVNKDKEFLKQEFLRIYYSFSSREALLVELFGTMQRFDLLRMQGTCKHIFLNDCETFNQIDKFWKCLFAVCECLTDSQVLFLKGRLLPNSKISVNSAEELLCRAYFENKFQKNNLKKLTEVFKEYPDCFNLIATYEGSQKLKYYPVKRPKPNNPCGLAVIFNHVEFFPNENTQGNFPPRPESQLDAESLKVLWQSFGFETTIYSNYSKEIVLKVFRSISRLDHSSFDVFIACYLSHGDEGLVYASDCQPILLIDLIGIMANECPSLVNKPKLFFVQACQGHQVQQGFGNPICTTSSQSVSRGLHFKSLMNTPLYSDTLIMTSSFPGFVSFRPIGENSWFIGALVEEMRQFGEELTISNIATKVINIVANKIGITQPVPSLVYRNCKQIPVILNTLKLELMLKKIIC